MTIRNVSTQNNSILKVLKYVDQEHFLFSEYVSLFGCRLDEVQQFTDYLDPLRLGPTIIHCHWHPQLKWPLDYTLRFHH